MIQAFALAYMRGRTCLEGLLAQPLAAGLSIERLEVIYHEQLMELQYLPVAMFVHQSQAGQG